MSPAECRQRLKFIGFTAHDEELLGALRPLFEAHSVAIEETLYQRLLSQWETGRVLRDPAVVDRLRQMHREYLVRIADGHYDDAYFETRLRLGQTLDRVGLDPHWFLLAYSHLFACVAPLIRHHYETEPQRAEESLVALHKMFTLDASLALDAYILSDRHRRLGQLESIVNDSADVIFMLDTEQRVRTWNRAAERIFGWRANEILGKPFHVLVPPERIASGEMEQIDRHIQEHGFHHFETTRLAKDKRRVPVEVTVSLLRDPQGRPIGRSAILRDITERQRHEQERLRTERLAVVGAMSAKLAHEMRNPLSSVTLNIDLVRDEIESLAQAGAHAPDEARGLIDAIAAEVRRIHRVLEDYLLFARLPKPQRQRVSLNEMLAQRLAFLQPEFQSSAVSLRTEMDAALPTVDADEEQLWQAMLNLIRNALEAMPQGGRLTVRAQREAGEAVLSVSDTGKGMTAEARAKLFKPFFSTKPGGTGLGLALTQQIIGEHGGRIEWESTDGRGTTFRVRLPLATKE